MKTKILLVCPMADKQSGHYLHDGFVKKDCQVAYFDWRKVIEERGVEGMNQALIGAIKTLEPDITLIIKGLGITGETIKEIKKFHKKPIVGWIFDVTLGGTYVKDMEPYVNFIKELDIFYTMDNDAVPELKELGVNAKWLTEGYSLPAHKEQVLNSVQRKKYGSDIIFLGSIGSIHQKRDTYLKRIWEEGFNLKIYGEMLYKEGAEPDWVKECHTGFTTVNDMHSLCCNSSKIVIGLDGWPERSKSWSARMYRTMAPGGFYLTTHTKDIEEHFEPGKHLDTFKDEDELIEKIIYWLGEDNKREEVGKAGQKLVLEKYSFLDRIQDILNDYENI